MIREVSKIKALIQSKKLLCAVLLTALLGGVVMTGCGKAEEEAGEVKNEVRKEANEKD